jgi:two-component system OmpR family sensor kinase
MSLRARLLAGMAVIAMVLALAAVAIVRITERNLMAQVDANLEQAIGRPIGEGPGPGPDSPSIDTVSSFYVGYVWPDRDIVPYRVPNSTEAVPRLTRANVNAALARPLTVASDDPDVRYRIRARPGRAESTVVLGTPLTDVDTTVRRLIGVEVVATIAVLGVLGLVTWWVIRLGVRPIKTMTVTASEIAAGNLSERVPEASPGTEAGELGVALNQMLGRIEGAFDERTRSEARLRQFVADASHELRTPVTTIRGYAELYRAGGLHEEGELEEAMRRTEQEAVRMGSLVDDLLLLARLDTGRPLEREPVELVAIAQDAVRDARAVDPDRPISASTDGPVTVLGDEARLRQVVANLVGNAMVHTPPGTPVDVRVGRLADRAVLEVVDHGPGMSDEVAARAFERFYRADPSRSRHKGGTGLGLAIVRATVSAHGGVVVLDTAPGQGTTVRVELPASLDSA